MKLDYFWQPSTVNSLSLQPGTHGNVFATASYDGILRLFDLRRNRKGNKIRLIIKFSKLLKKIKINEMYSYF